MLPFCDNPKCPNHVAVLYGKYLFIWDHNGNKHELKQHTHVFPDNSVARFCDWCNSAIAVYFEMMRNPVEGGTT